MIKVTDRLFLVLSATVFMTGLSDSEIICRVQRIELFDADSKVAAKLVGDSTSVIDDMKVYITVSNGWLYAQSNYLIPGFAFPSKLTADETIDLETLVLNRVCNDAGCITEAELKDAIAQRVTFYVEKFKLDRSQYSSRLSFDGVSHVIRDPTASLNPSPVSASSQAKRQASPNSTTAEHQSSLATPTNKDEKPPDGVVSAFVTVLWDSPGGKVSLVVCGVVFALFSLWSSLPDKAKSGVIAFLMGSFTKRKSQRRTRRNRSQ